MSERAERTMADGVANGHAMHLLSLTTATGSNAGETMLTPFTGEGVISYKRFFVSKGLVYKQQPQYPYGAWRS